MSDGNSSVDMLGVAVSGLEEIAAAPDLRIAQITAAGTLGIIRNRIAGDSEWKLVSRAEPGPEQPPAGQWERIAFMGHIEYTGRVTRFDRYGEPAYRIELPDLVFGGNPLAYREHRASMWFSSEPVSEESARAAWEARKQYQRPAIDSGWPYIDDDTDPNEGKDDGMSASEREEYDRDAEFALDAADESRDLEREAEDG